MPLHLPRAKCPSNSECSREFRRLPQPSQMQCQTRCKVRGLVAEGLSLAKETKTKEQPTITALPIELLPRETSCCQASYSRLVKMQEAASTLRVQVFLSYSLPA